MRIELYRVLQDGRVVLVGSGEGLTYEAAWRNLLASLDAFRAFRGRGSKEFCLRVIHSKTGFEEYTFFEAPNSWELRKRGFWEWVDRAYSFFTSHEYNTVTRIRERGVPSD